MTAADGDPSQNPRMRDEWLIPPVPPGGHQSPDHVSETPYSTYPEYGPPPRAGTNPLAIASLVISIAGLAPYLGGLLSVIGIVLGTVARNQIKQSPQRGYGLAVTGIVVGVATLIIGLIWTIYAMR